MNHLDKFEYFAVGNYLSSWPEEFCYTEIITNLEAGYDEEIWEAELYAGVPPEDLAYLIKEMESSLRRTFGG